MPVSQPTPVPMPAASPSPMTNTTRITTSRRPSRCCATICPRLETRAVNSSGMMHITSRLR